MTEIEYKAWCWSNRDGFSDEWKWLEDSQNGIHIFLQRQPVTSEISTQTTFAVGYSLGWNGNLDRNGLYFSVLVDNRNPVLASPVANVVMTLLDSETNTIEERFFLPIYPNGCNESRLEFSLVESKHIPDLLRLFPLLQAKKNYSVKLDFFTDDTFYSVHTVMNGKITGLDGNYTDLAMLRRTQKRLFKFFTSEILEKIPTARLYFANSNEFTIAEQCAKTLLKCSNIRQLKSTDGNESFELLDIKKQDDICSLIFEANKTSCIESLILTYASLFSFGIIELALSRYMSLMNGYSFIDYPLLLDVVNNMNNPYFNRLNPKSPLIDEAQNDVSESSDTYFP